MPGKEPEDYFFNSLASHPPNHLNGSLLLRISQPCIKIHVLSFPQKLLLWHQQQDKISLPGKRKSQFSV